MERLRLDKIIAASGRYSRREVKQLIRQGRVLVGGVPARSPEDKADPETEVAPMRAVSSSASCSPTLSVSATMC